VRSLINQRLEFLAFSHKLLDTFVFGDQLLELFAAREPSTRNILAG